MKSTLGTFVIPDDSGIVAIVDSARYRSFIREDWTLEEILERFRESMTQRSLLIWSPGCEGNWRVTAELGPCVASSFRSVEGTIEVSALGLHVVSYDSLTMAAQFADEPIPQPHERDNLIPLNPGRYLCAVQQAFDPETLNSQSVFYQETPHFILSFQATERILPPWPSVPWLVL